MKFKYLLFIFSFYVCSFVFAADPILAKSQTFNAAQKITKAVFLYEERNVDVNVQTNYNPLAFSDPLSLNSRRAYLGDTGFPAFGDLLVSAAAKSFSELGVLVIHSGYAPEGRLKDYERDLADQLGAEIQNTIKIVVTPTSASTSGHATGSSVKVSFSVEIVNSQTQNKIWVGEVLTSTHTGKGFISKNLFPGQIYDQTYAESIFKLLAANWRKAGLLQRVPS